MKMPRSSSSEDDNPGSSYRIAKWCQCQCGKLTLENERLFLAPPLITLGSSLAEFAVVFSITGFMAIDVIAVSSVCFSILLSLATLLFIRFDRLTILAFLMLSVSLLSSSTFLVICVERQKYDTSETSVDSLSSMHDSNHNIDEGHIPHELPPKESRHGSRLINLMKSGTELRWIHQLQSSERCCGFWNFTDWIEESSLLETNKSFKYHSEPIHPPTKWMVSCCDRNLTEDHSNCRAETIYDDWHDIVQYLFQEGCGERLDKKMDQVHHELLKTSVGLTVLDLIIAVDLVIYTVCRKLRTKSHNGCNGRNGTIGTEDDDVFT